MAKMLQSQFRAELLGGTPPIPGFWATTEGGALNREIGLAWDGGGGYDLLPAKTTAEDITLTRPYDPVTDDTWINTLRRNMDAGLPCTYNLSKRALGANDVALATETYANCPVRTVRTSPVTHGSEANPATVEIVLATKGPSN